MASGMQGHWGLNYPKKEYIEAAIDAYAALGVKVMITELDVDVLPLTKEGQIIGHRDEPRAISVGGVQTFSIRMPPVCRMTCSAS